MKFSFASQIIGNRLCKPRPEHSRLNPFWDFSVESIIITVKMFIQFLRLHYSLHFQEFFSSLNDPLIGIELRSELNILKEKIFSVKELQTLFHRTSSNCFTNMTFIARKLLMETTDNWWILDYLHWFPGWTSKDRRSSTICFSVAPVR